MAGRFVLVFGPAAGLLAAAAGTAASPLALYSNPARNLTTVSGAAPHAAVRLLDAVGHTVLAATADATGTASLALPAGLAAGVYVVQSGGQAQLLAVE